MINQKYYAEYLAGLVDLVVHYQNGISLECKFDAFWVKPF